MRYKKGDRLRVITPVIIKLFAGHNVWIVDHIKTHPFFSSIDWDAIYHKKIRPPFTPKIKSEYDTRYIDPEFTSCTPKDSVNVGESLENSENPYDGFSYNPNNNDKEAQQDNKGFDI